MSNSPMPESVANHIEALMIDEALNILSPEEEKELAAYLLRYPELVEQRWEIQSMMGLIAHAAPPISVSPHLKANILKQAQLRSVQSELNPDLRSAEAFPLRRPRRIDSQRQGLKIFPTVPSNVSWGLAAAASLLLVVLGIDNVNLRRQMRLDQEQITVLTAEVNHFIKHHADVHAFDLTGMPVVEGAMGTVILDFDAEQATIAVKNLPVATGNLAYHLWAFTEEGEQVFCGRFQSEVNGVALAYVPIDPDIYTSEIEFMRISLEPAVMPFQPDKRVMVMTSES